MHTCKVHAQSHLLCIPVSGSNDQFQLLLDLSRLSLAGCCREWPMLSNSVHYSFVNLFTYQAQSSKLISNRLSSHFHCRPCVPLCCPARYNLMYICTYVCVRVAHPLPSPLHHPLGQVISILLRLVGGSHMSFKAACGFNWQPHSLSTGMRWISVVDE